VGAATPSPRSTMKSIMSCCVKFSTVFGSAESDGKQDKTKLNQNEIESN
jgi:hypothetical protein